MFKACQADLATTSRYGFHISVQISEVWLTALCKFIEEGLQRLLCAALSDPEQPLAPGINLVNQGQELLFTLPPGDLIDTDRRYVTKVAMFQPPCDSHLDKAKDVVPTGLEDFRNLFP